MENELEAKDLVKVLGLYISSPVMGKLSKKVASSLGLIDDQSLTMFGNGNAKLLLTPLSKISDEDAIEVAKTEDENNTEKAYDWQLRKGKVISGAFITDNVYAYLFLISRSYAVPLFFAPNHWANGKTAIELGIAIEKK